MERGPRSLAAVAVAALLAFVGCGSSASMSTTTTTSAGITTTVVVSTSAAPSATRPGAQPATTNPASCPNGSYVNSSGNRVCSPSGSPSGPPAGATAKCNDGTYSMSQHRQGTCSGHGGVDHFL